MFTTSNPRSLSVFGGVGPAVSRPGVRPVTIDGVTLPCGLAPTAVPSFDPASAAQGSAALVRVRAVSCNYRDRGFLRGMAPVPASQHLPIGSEFVADVVAVGDRVTSLRPGDRVIPNHHYVGGAMPSDDGPPEGVISNRGSREVFHADKLIPVGPDMPLDVAASFSLGAQTAYSMVRRLDVRAGERVLVTSATSNTSLFLIAALRARGAVVYASTTSSRFRDRLAAMGVVRTFAIGTPRDGLPGVRDLEQAARELGRFHAVADPFCDLHLEPATRVLGAFGRYITCGFAAQNEHLAAEGGPVRSNLLRVMAAAIARNLTIMGNCLGLRSDLEAAVADWRAGHIVPIVDSVWTGDAVDGFLARTFVDRDRFGKVVFQYD
jgi:NADPH:quinone reductase-like Zn-dependent oxidoreductase